MDAGNTTPRLDAVTLDQLPSELLTMLIQKLGIKQGRPQVPATKQQAAPRVA
jgi:hypothetical protein